METTKTREERILRFIAEDRDRFVTERANLKKEAELFLAQVAKIPSKLLEGKVTPLPTNDVNILFQNLLSDKPEEETVAKELEVYNNFLAQMRVVRDEYIVRAEIAYNQRLNPNAANADKPTAPSSPEPAPQPSSPEPQPAQPSSPAPTPSSSEPAPQVQPAQVIQTPAVAHSPQYSNYVQQPSPLAQPTPSSQEPTPDQPTASTSTTDPFFNSTTEPYFSFSKERGPEVKNGDLSW